LQRQRCWSCWCAWAWLLYALWGWLRRRSLPQNATARAWRRWLPVVLVLATMIFLGREGAYFDGLKR
jgi:hypothetical protein